MRLARAIFVRLLFGALSLLFISLVTFVADEIAPGDQATVLAGEKASPETVAMMRERLGLNRPWPIRYVEYMGGVFRGDLGTSYYGTKQPVADIIRENLPMTLRTASAAILLSAIVGMILGTIGGIYENRFADRSVLIVSTLGVTLPNFVLAPLLVYVFCIQMDVLPQTWSPNRVAPDFMYLVLPVLVLAARPTAMLTRLTRASMIDTLQQEFIKLAVAKGVSPWRLYTVHALRNALLPVVTSIGTTFGFLLTGSFVVERFFILPGLGRETIEAIQQGNSPVIQACILVTGSLFIVVNLAVDLILPIIDPRIREAQV